MDTDRTVRVFTDFYRERGHHLITGSTLLPPPGDPVLFTTSGMHPLTPYLEGRPHPGAAASSMCSAVCAPPISTRSATPHI